MTRLENADLRGGDAHAADGGQRIHKVLSQFTNFIRDFFHSFGLLSQARIGIL